MYIVVFFVLILILVDDNNDRGLNKTKHITS